MRRIGSSTLLALSLIQAASAHRLDEYLQATLIGVTRDGVDVEIHLTPGVAMLPVLMAVIDQNHDGQISPGEQQAYVDRVSREVELQVDGVPATLSLLDTSFPTINAMREGLGTIAIKFHAARSGHHVRFENRHLPQFSAYLVNCLAAPLNGQLVSDGLVVGRPERDEAQRSIEFEYSLGSDASGMRAALSAVGPFWPAAIGMLLVARLAILIVKAQRHKRASKILTS